MEISQLIAEIKTFIFLGFIRSSLHNYMNFERKSQYYCFAVAKQFSIPGFYSVRLTHFIEIWHLYKETFEDEKKKLVNRPIITIFVSSKWDIVSLPLQVISPVHVACCLFSWRSETSKSLLVIVFREKMLREGY